MHVPVAIAPRSPRIIEGHTNRLSHSVVKVGMSRKLAYALSHGRTPSLGSLEKRVAVIPAAQRGMHTARGRIHSDSVRCDTPDDEDPPISSSELM